MALRNLFLKRREFNVPPEHWSLIRQLLDKGFFKRELYFKIPDTTLYINYINMGKGKDTIVISNPETKESKTVKLNLNDSITTLFFIILVIKDDYKDKTLFTNRSQL